MKVLLAALFTLSLHAQELTFLEKFATPTTRTNTNSQRAPVPPIFPIASLSAT